MIFGYTTKNVMRCDGEVIAIAEVQYDSLEQAIQCVYEVYLYLVQMEEKDVM